MRDIPTKYVVLIWIIALILFTFYCIFRLWYMNQPPKNASNKINKFDDTPLLPTVTSQNAIQYANDILARGTINDIPVCANMYDDNYGVRALGYTSCNSAYSDYLTKSLDSSKLYGQTKSLNDYCPVTTKNPVYMNCMATLLNKFNANANIFQGVNVAMTDSINKRLQDRSDILNDIQIDMAGYTGNKDITTFNAQTGLLDDSNISSNTKLYNASIYYKGKYASAGSSMAGSGLDSSYNPTVESFYSSTNPIIIVDPYIVKNFFSQYIPVKGQYLAFDNLQVTLDFDSSIPSTTTSTTATTVSAGMEPSNTGSASLTIFDNNTNGYIRYAIGGIGNYESLKNAIAIDISARTINVVNTGDDQALQQLLTVLGVTVPSKLILTLEELTNDLGKVRWSYKLMNSNMDTIMVMKKK